MSSVFNETKSLEKYVWCVWKKALNWLFTLTDLIPVLSGWACFIKSVCSSVCTHDLTFSRGLCTSWAMTFDSGGESNTGFDMYRNTWKCTLCKAGIVIEALETWRVVSCVWSLCSPDVQVLTNWFLQWEEFYLYPAGMWNEQTWGVRLSQKKADMLLKLGATVFMYSKKMGSATNLRQF